MKLITKEIAKKLLAVPLYSTEKTNVVPVLVKFFTPDANWTWYAVEAEQRENGDWLFFGMTEGWEKELGYFTLDELKTIRGGLGLPIERDMWFENRMLNKETMEVSR